MTYLWNGDYMKAVQLSQEAQDRGKGSASGSLAAAMEARAQARLGRERETLAAGLPAPVHLVTAEDVSAGKPDPEPYKAAATQLGASPSDCLAIDDSPAGIESASRAGCATLALLATHQRAELPGADAYAEDLSQVQVPGHSRDLRVEILTP